MNLLQRLKKRLTRRMIKSEEWTEAELKLMGSTVYDCEHCGIQHRPLSLLVGFLKNVELLHSDRSPETTFELMRTNQEWIDSHPG